MRVAKELSAGFGGSTELDDWETLVHKIHEIKEARADIRQINVFAPQSREWLVGGGFG